MMQRKSSLLRRRSLSNQIEEKQQIILPGASLFIFGNSSKVRQLIYRVVNLQYFDLFIILLIVITSIFLVIDDPLVVKSA